jgi:uncharacterized protein (TIGR00369 family)
MLKDSIWQKDFTLESLNKMSEGCMLENVGIVFTEKGNDYLIAKMPVTSKVTQPMGLLHGGASVAFAESVASVAANMAAPKGFICLGLQINANHIRAQKGGEVRAKAKAIFIGATTQVWDIKIINEFDKVVCSVSMTIAVRKKTKMTTLS